MKKLIGAFILGGLFCTGLFTLSSANPDQPAHPVSIGEAYPPAAPASTAGANGYASPVSIGEVLRAHNVAQGHEALSSFAAEAERLTSRPPGIDRDLPSFFERHVSVTVAGNMYKRYSTDPMRQREQFDLFDGGVPYHAVTERGRLAEEINQMTDSQSRDVEFSVKTFSLVPILKQLSDPTTEAVYLGRTIGHQDKFNVKTATGRWTLYADMEHLISRIELSEKVMEYASYRSVDGVRLPFVQRLFIRGQLFQEFVFTRIEINPTLPSGYFSREALAKEIVR